MNLATFYAIVLASVVGLFCAVIAAVEKSWKVAAIGAWIVIALLITALMAMHIDTIVWTAA